MLTTSDRGERWARLTVEPIAGDDGGPLYAVIAIEDLTEVKRAEIAQRLLAEVGDVLSDSAGIAALQRVTELAVPDFADWSTMNLPDGDEVRMVGVAARDRNRLALARQIADLYPPSRAAGPHARSARQRAGAGGRGRRRGASPPSPRMPSTASCCASAGARSAIFAPLASGSKILGTAISFVNAEGSRRFDDDDLAVAVEIGRRAGQAIETERLATARSPTSRQPCRWS